MILEIAIVILLLIILWLIFDKNRIIVYRFHKPTCIYCKMSNDDWIKFKNLNMLSMVKCIDIDLSNASDNEKKIIENFDIKSVPNIVAVKYNGERYKYDGERKTNKYQSWINSLI